MRIAKRSPDELCVILDTGTYNSMVWYNPKNTIPESVILRFLETDVTSHISHQKIGFLDH